MSKVLDSCCCSTPHLQLCWLLSVVHPVLLSCCSGRLKELINRGGEKISPLEIDSVLLGHPDVAEAVCFGAPDEKYGEVVAAVVVLRQGAPQDVADDIRAYCKTRLAAFKV